MSSRQSVWWLTFSVLYSMSGRRHLANTLIGVRGWPCPAAPSRLRLAKLDALDTSEIGSGVSLPWIGGGSEDDVDADPKLLLKEADPVELREALSTEVVRLRREVDRRRDGSTLLLLWQCFSISVTSLTSSL